MTKFLTAAAIGAMLTAGAAVAMQSDAPAPPKAPMTKAQMLARADARFEALDTNKDGQLSADERKAGMDRARAAMADRAKAGGAGGEMGDFMPGAGRRGGGGGMGEKMLARIDTNGDGLISRAENRAAAEARFDRMDANKNGVIDPGERRGGRDGKGWGGKRPGGPDGERMGARGPGRGPEGRGGMMAADTNGDGAVSRAEFDAASAARFARMDTNKDGKIDAADRPQRRMAPPAPAPAAPPAPGAD